LRLFRYLGQITFRNFRKLPQVCAPKALITVLFAERKNAHFGSAPGCGYTGGLGQLAIVGTAASDGEFNWSMQHPMISWKE
jgi:hypothetical protein